MSEGTKIEGLQRENDLLYNEKYYQVSPEINPEGPQGRLKMKVLRGGSWVNSIESVKVVKRARNYPNIKNEIYGFRSVLPIP